MQYQKALGSAAALAALLGVSCGGTETSIAQEQYLLSCEQAQEMACERGFSCDSFFAQAKFSSVAHCKHELAQQRQAAAAQMNAHQLDSCASACQVMKSDAENVSCDDFDDLVFKRYSCGN